MGPTDFTLMMLLDGLAVSMMKAPRALLAISP